MLGPWQGLYKTRMIKLLKVKSLLNDILGQRDVNKYSLTNLLVYNIILKHDFRDASKLGPDRLNHITCFHSYLMLG